MSERLPAYVTMPEAWLDAWESAVIAEIRKAAGVFPVIRDSTRAPLLYGSRSSRWVSLTPLPAGGGILFAASVEEGPVRILASEELAERDFARRAGEVVRAVLRPD